MKIKKIKLLKALALTGAFGIVATVPVIVSACSSTSDNNTGGGTDQGGGSTQSEKITPELNDKVSLSGSLKDIYDSTGATKTNELLAKEIKDNIKTVFKNGEKLEAESDLKITVDGNFPETLNNWKDLPYLASSDDASKPDATKSWSGTANLQSVVYATSSEQINIKSLDDLHTQLSVEKTLKDALSKAGVTETDKSTYVIKNKPGLTNDDLIHVNVEGTKTDDKTKTEYDLQIPTSDINLVINDLSVKVEGKNIETKEDTKTTIAFDFNIGIDSTAHFDKTSKTVTAADDTAAKNVNEVFKQLTFGEVTSDKLTLKNETIMKELGIYNVTFSADGISIANKTSKARATTPTDYTVTLKATPNTGYVWDDGTSAEKEISFDITVQVGK